MLVSLTLAGIVCFVVLSQNTSDSRVKHEVSLERILKETRRQDGEFLNSMDSINLASDGPVERQAAAMESSSSVLSTMDLLKENPATQDLLQVELITGPEQEYYDGTKGPQYGPIRKVGDYEDLVFCTIVNDLNSTHSLELLRAFVGGIHQLRQGRHRIPRIELLTPLMPAEIPESIAEEISWWNNVQLRNIHNILGLPMNKAVQFQADEHQIRLALLSALVKERGHAIWIKFGYVVEPERILIYRAENKGSVMDLVDAYRLGREKIMEIAQQMNTEGVFTAIQGERVTFSNKLPITPRKTISEQELVKKLYTSGEKVIEAYSLARGLELLTNQLRCNLRPETCNTLKSPPVNQTIPDAASFGVFPSDPSSQAGCLVDIREEGITNSILIDEVASTPPTNQFNRLLAESSKKTIRKVALALPTTSKGMEVGGEPVFLKYLMPSFLNTVTEEEYRSTLFTVYIGYDHGDPLYEDETVRADVIKKLTLLIGQRPVQVKLLQLPNARRIALLWNLLYLHALREGAEYFYQVNDDLTLKSPGWLSYFTATLDAKHGFGVVGPADYHNGLNCTILTQSMVTPVHFDIFGMLYPIELKDWKSDRWLTYVYQPDDMHCRPDVIADNGGTPTRYKHCEFLSYVIYLEAGKRRIAEWKAHQKSLHKSL